MAEHKTPAIGEPLYPHHGDAYTNAIARATAEYNEWLERDYRFYVYSRKLEPEDA